ncbi:MAG: plasmid pRiA4b ORF-3 family protein [Acidimicrobiales bacterium]|nr:plasmid pRiA4b ORF-3 family protein [Acidimicrobiales bacterium]
MADHETVNPTSTDHPTSIDDPTPIDEQHPADVVDLTDQSEPTPTAAPELGEDSRLFRNDPAATTLWIALREVQPSVWRRIVVPAETKLPKLARLLAAAMGWEGKHRHLFHVGDLTFGPADPEEIGLIDERRITVAQLLPTVGARLTWAYDFGDDWEHDVVVEAIDAIDAGVRYPFCLAGERACPPEDCGGAWGYGNVLAALADPGHPDHEEVVDWVPSGFDADGFDIDAVTKRVRQLRRGRERN